MTGTELELVDAEIVEASAPLSEGQAKVLDKRIRQAQARFTDEGVKLLDLLKEAELGQIHVALGLSSWRAYVRETVHISPADEVERKSMVSLMSGKGFSQRDIADAINVNQSTVSRDLAEGDAPASGETVGRDDKIYKREPKPKQQEPLDVEEVVEPRTALDVIADFRENMQYLEPAVQAFTDLQADDAELFAKARKRIAKSHLNPLTSMIADLQKIVDELMS